MQAIPLSVRARIAEVQCNGTVQRNPQLFAGCNEQFLSYFMLNLVEVFFLPGETVLKHGEIARELNFAKRGVVMVMDVKDVLVELVSGEGALPCLQRPSMHSMPARTCIAWLSRRSCSRQNPDDNN